MAGHAYTANGQLGESTTLEPDGTDAPEEAAERADDAESIDESSGTDSTDESDDSAATERRQSGVRLALAFGIIALLMLGALAGWLGFRAYQAHQAMKQRELFLQAARQGAINLTTISYTEAEADVQRILNSSTGNLYDDFLKRSQPFIEVVKQAQSTSAGTVTSAGLESIDGDEAQVLVTVQVNSSNAGAAEQPPRAWRMRMNVKQVGDGAKVSNVAFVP